MVPLFFTVLKQTALKAHASPSRFTAGTPFPTTLLKSFHRNCSAASSFTHIVCLTPADKSLYPARKLLFRFTAFIFNYEIIISYSRAFVKCFFIFYAFEALYVKIEHECKDGAYAPANRPRPTNARKAPADGSQYIHQNHAQQKVCKRADSEADVAAASAHCTVADDFCAILTVKNQQSMTDGNKKGCGACIIARAASRSFYLTGSGYMTNYSCTYLILS